MWGVNSVFLQAFLSLTAQGLCSSSTKEWRDVAAAYLSSLRQSGPEGHSSALAAHLVSSL